MHHRDEPSTTMNDWPSVRAWRNSTRKDLLQKRMEIPREERRCMQQKIVDTILNNFPNLPEESIGFYWPIKGELNLRPMLMNLLAEGADASLPVVVKKDQPLEFWAWDSGTEMSRGIGNIPVPTESRPVQPTVLLIPLVGYDRTGQRLGYGGGYYDRTLAAFRLKPMTIGVGYSLGELPTIHPQTHDMPFDAIITEKECLLFNHQQRNQSGPSSPPCYLHEFDGEKD